MMGTLDMLLNAGNSTMVGVLVFLAAATLTFSIMVVVRVQGSVNRAIEVVISGRRASRPFSSARGILKAPSVY